MSTSPSSSSCPSLSSSSDASTTASSLTFVADLSFSFPFFFRAEVRAYYQVAQKVSSACNHFSISCSVLTLLRSRFQQRTIDNIPRAIQNRLVDAFTIRIQGAILAELQPSGEGSVERCARFLQEAPDVVHKREELLAKKSKLQAAAFKISTF